MSSRESALLAFLSSAFGHTFSASEARDPAKLRDLALVHVDAAHFAATESTLVADIKSYLLHKLNLRLKSNLVWPLDSEWVRVLELVLLCAVNCEDKEKYVECIVGLEEMQQTELMNVIQSLMALDDEEDEQDMEHDLDVKRFVNDLHHSQAESDVLKQRVHDMQAQINLLNDEKANLAQELQHLQAQMGGKDGNSSRSLLLRQQEESGLLSQELKRQLETLQETLYKSELQRDELHSRVEDMEKKLEAATTREMELQKLADEAIVLKDEVDILRETAEKAEKFEDVVTAYKKKLEEMGDLRRQVKLLEEKNAMYVQKNVELEEDVKRTGNWRPQMEAFKKELSELHSELDSETKKNDQLSFESKQLREQVQNLQEERNRLQTERDELRVKNDELQDELKFGQLSKSSNNNGDGIRSDDSSLEMIPQSVKERLLRLQHENKVMRETMGKNENDDKQVLQTIVEELKIRDTKLQAEARKANQRVIELEAQLKKDNSDGQNTGDATLNDAYKKIAQLEEDVKKKELEIAGMEERYKKYIEKAKSVIKTLDPKQQQQQQQQQNEASSGLIQSQIADKNRVIESMEREAEKSRAIREMEERLIASAYYNLSMQLHKNAVEQRLSTATSRQQAETKHSFLARQRAIQGRGKNDDFAQFS